MQIAPRLEIHGQRSTFLRILTGILVALFRLALTVPSGCGVSGVDSRPPPKVSTVIHPSAEELAAGAAVPGSYLVALRGELGGAGPTSLSFFQEFQTHMQTFESRFRFDRRVKEARFLSILPQPSTASGDLRDPKTPLDGLLAPPLNRLRGADTAPEISPTSSLLQIDFISLSSAKEALAEWDQEGALWFAEPNGMSQLAVEDRPNFGTLAAQYRTENEWWTDRIGLPQAYDTLNQITWPSTESASRSRPIIAVLDSGVDYEHPALKDRIWTNPQRGVAGCDNDLHGCDTTKASAGRLGQGSVWPFDLDGPGKTCIGKDSNCSHGTHVAGIIAADSRWLPSGGDRPILGVCPLCRIMILKIVSKVGSRSGILDSSIVAALKYISFFRRASGLQVRVINASFGKFSKSRSVGLLLRALRQEGGLVIAAAGNEDSLRREYPAAFPDAVAVAAVDEKLRKVSFSNFGSWVDLSAPGAGITSTVPGEMIDTKSGTSMAAPMVAGVAGLLLAQSPDLTFDDLRERLLNSSDPSLYSRVYDQAGLNERFYYSSAQKGKEPKPLLGLGFLNANAAVGGQKSAPLRDVTSPNRVQPGCGVIRQKLGLEEHKAAPFDLNRIFLFLSLMIPLGAHLKPTRSSRETSSRL